MPAATATTSRTSGTQSARPARATAGCSPPTASSTRTTRARPGRTTTVGMITGISASPTACPLRGYRRAGTQNDRLSEAVILSTGTPIPAQWTCRRRCQYRWPMADVPPVGSLPELLGVCAVPVRHRPAPGSVSVFWFAGATFRFLPARRTRSVGHNYIRP